MGVASQPSCPPANPLGLGSGGPCFALKERGTKALQGHSENNFVERPIGGEGFEGESEAFLDTRRDSGPYT